MYRHALGAIACAALSWSSPVYASSPEEAQQPEENQKRLIMALARGTVSALAATWPLAAQPDVGLPAAAAVGLSAGLFSAAIQYKMSSVQAYMGRGKSLPGRCARWLGIEAPFVSVLVGMEHAMGIATGGLAQAIATVAGVSLLGLGSQGIWDVAIVEDMGGELAQADPAAARRIRLMSEAKALGVAFVSIAASALTTGEPRLGAGVMLTIGAIGAGKYAWRRIKVRQKTCEDTMR
jgi:hypothetical protein